MRGPKPTHPIDLTAEEVQSFQQLIRAHTTPQTVAVRARIMLRAHEHPEQNTQQIAQAVGTTDRMLRKWRGRWVATHSLAAAPRSGAPRRFPPQVRAQVTAIACSWPKQCQVPLARWSRAEVAQRVAQDKSLPPISARTGGRWLKAERLRAWR